MDEQDKKYWRSASVGSGSSKNEIADIIDGKRRTALQNLARRYKVFSNLCWGCMLFILPMTRNEILQAGPWRTVIIVWYLLYMLSESYICRRFYLAVKGIDVAGMPVAEVARKAVLYRKRHLQCMMVEIPMSLAFVLLLGFYAYSCGQGYLISGMVVGGAAGLAIGTRQFYKFMADYRDISGDL